MEIKRRNAKHPRRVGTDTTKALVLSSTVRGHSATARMRGIAGISADGFVSRFSRRLTIYQRGVIAGGVFIRLGLKRAVMG
jgi:hypothetical protein